MGFGMRVRHSTTPPNLEADREREVVEVGVRGVHVTAWEYLQHCGLPKREQAAAMHPWPAGPCLPACAQLTQQRAMIGRAVSCLRMRPAYVAQCSAMHADDERSEHEAAHLLDESEQMQRILHLQITRSSGVLEALLEWIPLGRPVPTFYLGTAGPCIGQCRASHRPAPG